MITYNTFELLAMAILEAGRRGATGFWISRATDRAVSRDLREHIAKGAGPATLDFTTVYGVKIRVYDIGQAVKYESPAEYAQRVKETYESISQQIKDFMEAERRKKP